MGGDKAGRKIVARASAAVIALKHAVLNVQVRVSPLSSANDSGQGVLSGELTELVE
jgi:hypothetical protein